MVSSHVANHIPVRWGKYRSFSFSVCRRHLQTWSMTSDLLYRTFCCAVTARGFHDSSPHVSGVTVQFISSVFTRRRTSARMLMVLSARRSTTLQLMRYQWPQTRFFIVAGFFPVCNNLCIYLCFLSQYFPWYIIYFCIIS